MKMGSMDIGSRPKSKRFRVVSESVKSFNPPPEYVEMYWIEDVSTGKRLKKSYHSLEQAELECKEMNNLECEPD
ncbi:MAG: hypothetical protein U0989_06665 [Azonexus sp.]|nr:hypothetical protein [Azonexus sp.]MDZ4314432.1 hypothetical protein [Azonexus sp.]